MSSLTDSDKRYLEEILGMHTGYVLDFTDATFGKFFERYDIDIHGSEYQIYGTSKAKKLRAFWESESDQLVGVALNEMLNSYEATCELNNKELDTQLLTKARSAVKRLTHYSASSQSEAAEKKFLAEEFKAPDFQKTPLDSQVVSIVEARLDEARTALRSCAHLSVILLCGSILEAVLLGVAKQTPARFNRAKAAPKTDGGSPKPFHNWSLAQLIDVACEIGILYPDVKRFSHGLRDFRNYIHPHEQIKSGFTPDKHTARLCLQALNAALANLTGERS